MLERKLIIGASAEEASPKDNTSGPVIDCWADEYSRKDYVSPQNVKIAIKNVTRSVSPYKDEITLSISAGLHAIGESMTFAHMSGAHLRGPIKYLGPACEMIAESIHHPSDKLTEKIVCGTVVTLAKEAVNVTFAVNTSVAIALAASVEVTPIAGFTVAGITAVGAYKMAGKITEPLAHMVQQKCYAMFNHAQADDKIPEDSQLSGNHIRDISLTHTDLLQAQTSLTNPLWTNFPNQEAGIERLQNSLSLMEKNNPSLRVGNHISSGNPFSTKNIMESLSSLHENQYESTYAMTSSRCTNPSRFTESPPTVYCSYSPATTRLSNLFFSEDINVRFITIPKPDLVISYASSGLFNHYNNQGKSGHCDPRFENCGNAGNFSGNCHDASSSTCKSSLF